MVLHHFCPAELVKVGKVIFAISIDRFEVDGSISVGNDLTPSEDVDGEIHCNRAGMKQVQRPKIQRAAGQVHTA